MSAVTFAIEETIQRHSITVQGRPMWAAVERGPERGRRLNMLRGAAEDIAKTVGATENVECDTGGGYVYVDGVAVLRWDREASNLVKETGFDAKVGTGADRIVTDAARFRRAGA